MDPNESQLSAQIEISVNVAIDLSIEINSESYILLDVIVSTLPVNNILTSQTLQYQTQRFKYNPGSIILYSNVTNYNPSSDQGKSNKQSGITKRIGKRFRNETEYINQLKSQLTIAIVDVIKAQSSSEHWKNYKYKQVSTIIREDSNYNSESPSIISSERYEFL